MITIGCDHAPKGDTLNIEPWDAETVKCAGLRRGNRTAQQRGRSVNTICFVELKPWFKCSRELGISSPDPIPVCPYNQTRGTQWRFNMNDVKTTTRQSREADRRPAYVVRSPDPNNKGRWITLGAAWKLKDGKEGFSIRLHAVPVGNNWDGALVLLPPYEDEGAAPE
jgi:hypothetical protein